MNPRAELLAVLESAKSDNLERAEYFFKDLPTPLMNAAYGSSGRTRQEILDGYREARRKHNALVAWVKAHVPEVAPDAP